MEKVLLITSLWLHALATVVLIGHYLLLALVYMPVLSRQSQGAAIRTSLVDISGRVRSWIFGSLLVFIVTGVYLMFSDNNYQGFGDFGNTWAILMMVKHVLVIVMIGLGVNLNRVLSKEPEKPSKGKAAQFKALPRVKLLLNLMATSGILVLLLTAIAQVE